MRHQAILLFAAFVPCIGLSAGCGDTGNSSSSSSAGNGGGGTGGSGGTGGVGGGVGGGIGGGSECPSQLLCGSPAECCAVGEECVSGACATACPSGVHCAGGCCQSGQVCLSGVCATPTTTCQDSFDCAEGEFCEPSLKQCLPQPQGGALCTYKPPVGPFEPVLEWSWTGSPIQPAHDQILSTPLVGDLDQDGSPDVVIVTHDKGDGACDTGHAYLRALDGKTGQEKWAAGVDAYKDTARVALCRNPALADLDGDGKPEIIAARFGGGLVALPRGRVAPSGPPRWPTPSRPTRPTSGLAARSAMANMDGDGKPEIVVAWHDLQQKDGSLRARNGLENAGEQRVFGAEQRHSGHRTAMARRIAVTAARRTSIDGNGHLEPRCSSTDTRRIADFWTSTDKPELVVITGGIVARPRRRRLASS
jgi:hypothetical protein